MLLSIISSTLPFPTILAADEPNTNDDNGTINDEISTLVNSTIIGTDPSKHILSIFDASFAAKSYSRINSILRYDITKRFMFKKELYINLYATF